MRKTKDIIFDLDGTLIRSREQIYEINRIVFSEATDREVTMQESVEKFCPEFTKLFEVFEVSCPFKQKQAISKWGVVSSQMSYEMFDGISELLDTLGHLNFRLHLWTARDQSSAQKILNDHRLEKHFTTFSFSNEVDSKPNSNNLNFDWKLSPSIVIGDSPSDVLGAKNIGALSIGVLWDSHAKEQPLVAHGADLIFLEPKQLKDWFSSSTF